MIDIRKLKELVRLMVENDLSELDLGDILHAAHQRTLHCCPRAPQIRRREYKYIETSRSWWCRDLLASIERSLASESRQQKQQALLPASIVDFSYLEAVGQCDLIALISEGKS